MNIPTGELVEKRVSFEKAAADKKLNQLLNSSFNGYLVATAEGITGIEEAILLLRENEIIGAIFEAISLNKTFYGVEGLRLCLNLLKAKKGVFDVNALTKQQIDLIIAFNDKIELPHAVGIDTFLKLLPATYRGMIVNSLVKGELEGTEEREKILKRFGLGSI